MFAHSSNTPPCSDNDKFEAGLRVVQLFTHDVNKLLTLVQAQSYIIQGFPITEKYGAITCMAKWATDLQHVSPLQRNSTSALTTRVVIVLLFSQPHSGRSTSRVNVRKRTQKDDF